MGKVDDKGKTAKRLRTSTKIHMLKIEDFDKTPHKDFVKKIITEKLNPLKDVLKIDFSGKAKKALYIFSFVHEYKWTPLEKKGNQLTPSIMGISEEVNTEMLRTWNYCEDVNDAASCKPLFPNTSDMLGKAIANTALHEIGHMFGLLNENSYSGSSDSGHTGDSSNIMFDIPLHKDYKKKYERTKKYLLKNGETPDKIASRRGTTLKKLLKFRGKDGRTNEQILKKGEKEIWILDVDAELKYRRGIESENKSFSDEQILFMKKWIQNGKTMQEHL